MVRGQLTKRLQQQCALARPGMATDQDARARHQATAKHPIKLIESGAQPRQIHHGDLFQSLHGGHRARIACPAHRAGAGCFFGRGAQANFRQGIPGMALAALTLPLGEIGPTVIADKCSFCLRHGKLSGN